MKVANYTKTNFLPSMKSNKEQLTIPNRTLDNFKKDGQSPTSVTYTRCYSYSSRSAWRPTRQFWRSKDMTIRAYTEIIKEQEDSKVKLKEVKEDDENMVDRTKEVFALQTVPEMTLCS